MRPPIMRLIAMQRHMWLYLGWGFPRTCRFIRGGSLKNGPHYRSPLSGPSRRRDGSSMPPDPAEARRWLEKADRDRRTAETVLAQIPPITDTGAFHAQQA